MLKTRQVDSDLIERVDKMRQITELKEKAESIRKNSDLNSKRLVILIDIFFDIDKKTEILTYPYDNMKKYQDSLQEDLLVRMVIGEGDLEILVDEDFNNVSNFSKVDIDNIFRGFNNVSNFNVGIDSNYIKSFIENDDFDPILCSNIFNALKYDNRLSKSSFVLKLQNLCNLRRAFGYFTVLNISETISYSDFYKKLFEKVQEVQKATQELGNFKELLENTDREYRIIELKEEIQKIQEEIIIATQKEKDDHGFETDFRFEDIPSRSKSKPDVTKLFSWLKLLLIIFAITFILFVIWLLWTL